MPRRLLRRLELFPLASVWKVHLSSVHQNVSVSRQDRIRTASDRLALQTRVDAHRRCGYAGKVVLQVESCISCVGAIRTASRPSAQRTRHASLEELSAVSLLADRSAARSTPSLVLLLSAVVLCTQALPVLADDSRRLATVPALGVLAGGQTGIVHYIVLQIDKDPRRGGPT